MMQTSKQATRSIRWGIYHQEREFAHEVGDPCLRVVDAPSKLEAETKAREQGITGPTGLWAHPLPPPVQE